MQNEDEAAAPKFSVTFGLRSDNYWTIFPGMWQEY